VRQEEASAWPTPRTPPGSHGLAQANKVISPAGAGEVRTREIDGGGIASGVSRPLD
jgi:hypothetical protein